ncbi:ArsR/SmtB family transcription factor [Mangrovitalea sediminis]|uniref:ArsR/SmtB family transcription factor n=1 Tax=Mangrovitalea sediminis TaxID=1982043 RepID=UPI000BE5252B|nr:metalloregulator ArsR/SmtB family transcription factor [Mangrovitalea sediminis]
MNTQQTLSALAALAQENRLAIFRRLVIAGPEGLTPGALSQALELAPATLSFHLKELLHAGLLRKRQEGRFIHYQADFAAMNGVIAYLTENCCQGESCDLEDAGCAAPMTGDPQ